MLGEPIGTISPTTFLFTESGWPSALPRSSAHWEDSPSPLSCMIPLMGYYTCCPFLTFAAMYEADTSLKKARLFSLNWLVVGNPSYGHGCERMRAPGQEWWHGGMGNILMQFACYLWFCLCWLHFKTKCYWPTFSWFVGSENIKVVVGRFDSRIT